MVQVAAGEEDRQLSVRNPIFVSLLRQDQGSVRYVTPKNGSSKAIRSALDPVMSEGRQNKPTASKLVSRSN